MSRHAGSSITTFLKLNPAVPSPTSFQIHHSQTLFSHTPLLRFTVGRVSQLPTPDSPEVAFLGRSNVGKSSLLNALFPAAPKNFARVSSKPGHTRTLNGFTISNRKFTIIDLPGYGFKGDRFEEELRELVVRRRSLKMVYLLLSSVHGPKPHDIAMLELLSKTGIAHQLVLTKIDLSPATLWKQVAAAVQLPSSDKTFKTAVRENSKVLDLQMGEWGILRGKVGLGCNETILGVSSEDNLGITELRCSILQACGLFWRDSAYATRLRDAPVVESSGEEAPEKKRDVIHGKSRFDDDNPMRGKVFGGRKMIAQKIYRW